jgi:hypothetical protein
MTLPVTENKIIIIKCRRKRKVGRVACMRTKRTAYRGLTGKPEGKGSLGRPGRRWEDNIKMGLRGIGWDGVVLIHLTRDRDQWRVVVNTAMNFRVQ